MTEHIVAVFRTESAAAAAEQDLVGAGIPISVVRRYTPAEMERLDPESSDGGATETSHSSGGGFWAWLWGEDTDSAYYAFCFFDRGATVTTGGLVPGTLSSA